MDRTSGWYKRRAQSCLLLIGIAIAFGGNLNTIAVARWLWQGDVGRQTAVTAAREFMSKTSDVPTNASLNKLGDLAKTSEGKQAAKIIQIDQQISALQYPIGWHAGPNVDNWPS